MEEISIKSKLVVHRIIFLDIDGVLNTIDTKERCQGCIGIDEEKVKILSKIINSFEYEPLVVLTSTWKSEWERVESINDLSVAGQYLVRHLHRWGVHILDKTDDVYENTRNLRGQSILNWIKNADLDIYSILVLDDESFDYSECGLEKYHLKTSFYDNPGGLLESHIEKALEILNTPSDL